MGKIINLREVPSRSLARERSNQEAYDRFLLSEGLDLLAAYRSIADANLRRRLLEFVRDLAAAR